MMKRDAAIPPGAARGAVSQTLASTAISVAPGTARKGCAMLRVKGATKAST
eukprot:CAMPEP_0172711508 /NCGR_PEP_ID=MMETSP1074-20121228/59357_1 /TAXON_ID=2916 /ORGANISM="Ceratium fusus, Strain PA161109" /LENGTH=50 /DNA_ID=CAMNT_0013535207 /DNA_START=14 /DNA_END=166 /DNA_ORIENTATION=+